MRVIVCLDERKGMLFHRRRQSRDRRVAEDIAAHLEGRPLWVSPFSKGLFSAWEQVRVAEDPLAAAGLEEFCFIEGLPLAPWLERIQSLTVYWWNRRYPGDVFLDVDLSRWRVASRQEFPGFSHEKITKEVYIP